MIATKFFELQVKINGEQHKITGVNTVSEILREFGYEKHSVTVTRNGSFVPRATYTEPSLSHGEIISILAAASRN
jgi:thiamine biosynthesis protein ThiS